MEEAFDIIKARVETLLHTARMMKTFMSVMESKSCPFPDEDVEEAFEIFHRCNVVSHSVHKDNEWTLGGRRDVCGAHTSVALQSLGQSDEDGEIEINVKQPRHPLILYVWPLAAALTIVATTWLGPICVHLTSLES